MDKKQDKRTHRHKTTQPVTGRSKLGQSDREDRAEPERGLGTVSETNYDPDTAGPDPRDLLAHEGKLPPGRAPTPRDEEEAEIAEEIGNNLFRTERPKKHKGSR